MAIVASLYRYPVKGLGPERLSAVDLEEGWGAPRDRAFAIRHGQTVFDAAKPAHLSKTKFLALMTYAALAKLDTAFEDDGTTLVLHMRDRPVFRGSLLDAADVARLDAFMADFIGGGAKGAPRLASAEGHMFSDVPEKCLSVVNIASVKALGDHLGNEINPMRFRANIYLGGLDAWTEHDWVNGSEFYAGDVRLRLMRPIVRCRATNVNLETAEIDHNLSKTLAKEFGANLMGIYCTVEKGGRLATGDEFKVVVRGGKPPII